MKLDEDFCKALFQISTCKFSFEVLILFLSRGGSRGRVQRVRNPLPLEMKPPSSYSLLKFVYLAGL